MQPPGRANCQVLSMYTRVAEATHEVLRLQILGVVVPVSSLQSEAWTKRAMS